MSEDKTTEILKSAILLERKGNAFYSQVSEQASGPAVKSFFEMMANQEVEHIRVLSDQYKAYQKNEKFTPGDYQADNTDNIASNVLTKELIKEISAADYEAAAITAAMSMEKNAIDLYASRASEAEDPNEKALYEWLAKWETEHLNFLAEIDKELTEQIWYESNFWPF